MPDKSVHEDADAPKLLAYLDGLVDHLRRLVPKAMRGSDVEAIHDARVATRRLKASVDLLQPVLDKSHVKPFAQTLRKLRRRLGPLRDLDVICEHLAELEIAEDPDRSAAIAWLRVRFESERDNALNDAREKSPSNKTLAKLGAWWGLREQIGEADEAIGPLLRESMTTQFAEFARSSNQLIARSDGEHVDPHAIRIAGKSLRYTLEMAQEHGLPVGSKIGKTFKRMQEALGLWHDFIVLTERMLSCSGGEKLAHHDAPTQRAILALSQHTLKKSEQQLQKFASLWESHHHELAESIGVANAAEGDVAPAELPVEPETTESQTDRDPSHSADSSVLAGPETDAPEAA